jgi:hypothetical protein
MTFNLTVLPVPLPFDAKYLGFLSPMCCTAAVRLQRRGAPSWTICWKRGPKDSKLPGRDSQLPEILIGINVPEPPGLAVIPKGEEPASRSDSRVGMLGSHATKIATGF